MLLNSHEVDRKHQLESEESLDEQALSDRSTMTKLCLNDVGAREDTLHDSRGQDASEDLAAGQEDSLDPSHLSDEAHSKGDLILVC